jgi:hypothetical protein
MQKRIHAPVFRGLSGNGFIRIHPLKYRYRGGVNPLKNRDAFIKRKASDSREEAVRQVGTHF